MDNNSISSRGTRAFYWGMAGALGKVSGQLLVQITLARILDPVTFGQFAAVIVVFGVGLTLAEGGFGSALIQTKELHSADVSFALGWSLILSGAMAVFIILSAPLLARELGDASLGALFRVCAILIPFQIVSNLSSSLLRRDLHMRGIQIISIISYTVCFGGVAVALAIMGWGVWSLVAGFATQTIFSMIATYSISRHTLRPRLTGDRTLIQFGLKSLATELTNWCMGSLDRFLIGKFWGLYSLGLYSVASNLSKAPSGMLVYTAQSIAFAGAARLQGDLAAVRKGFLVALTAVALATLPIFTLVAFDSATVLHIVYGAKWIGAAPYMTALAVSIPTISMGAIAAAILRGIGGAGAELRIQTVTGVVLFSGLLLLQNASLAIAVWAVPLAYLVRFLLLLDMLRNRLELRMADMLHPFRGAFVLSAAGLCAAAFVHGPGHASTIGEGVMPIVAGCCAIALLVAYRFTWFLGAPLVDMARATFATARLGSAIVRLKKEKC